MNIHERIGKEVAADPYADPKQISGMILNMVSKQDLEPLLIDAIENRQRAYVRQIEQTRFHETIQTLRHSAGMLVDPPVTTLHLGARERFERMRVLLDQEIAVGRNGEKVKWGDATIDELRVRLGMLDEQIAGLNETRSRTAEAIEVLEQSGATCLNDLATGKVLA